MCARCFLWKALTESGISDFTITRYKQEGPSSDGQEEWDCVVRVGEEAKVYLSHNASHIDTSNAALRDALVKAVMALLTVG